MADSVSDVGADEEGWRRLTWDDLEGWTDTRSLQRGRSYQRSGHVRDLARSAEGVLVAWVDGQERYATTVRLIAGPEDTPVPSSRCTCPLGMDGCKHGVAVVLAYLEALKKGEDVPPVGESDRRWRRLEEAAAEGADESDAFDDSEEKEVRPPVGTSRPLAAGRESAEGPHGDDLLHRALVENRPDDVLHWFDHICAALRASPYGLHGPGPAAGRVAEAVAETHPERAAELYRQLIEHEVSRASSSGYESAGPYLRKLRAVLERLNRPEEWAAYTAGLRETHRRKRRFLEVLDRLENRPMVNGRIGPRPVIARAKSGEG